MKIKYLLKIIQSGFYVFLIFLLPMGGIAGQGYDLDKFDDLELEPLDKPKNRTIINNNDKQRIILFDDNLYFLDDDFDFGSDELELQKLELNPDDLETAQEYEDFLNAFLQNAIPVGRSSYNGSNNSNQKKSKISQGGNNSNSKSSRK